MPIDRPDWTSTPVNIVDPLVRIVSQGFTGITTIDLGDVTAWRALQVYLTAGSADYRVDLVFRDTSQSRRLRGGGSVGLGGFQWHCRGNQMLAVAVPVLGLTADITIAASGGGGGSFLLFAYGLSVLPPRYQKGAASGPVIDLLDASVGAGATVTSDQLYPYTGQAWIVLRSTSTPWVCRLKRREFNTGFSTIRVWNSTDEGGGFDRMISLGPFIYQIEYSNTSGAAQTASVGVYPVITS